MLATLLVRKINDTLPNYNLEMHELFENLTIEALAQLYRFRVDAECNCSVSEGEDKPVVATAGMVEEQHVLVSDIKSICNQIQELKLPPHTPSSSNSNAAIFVTGATGWLGAHVVAELLLKTQSTLFCLVRAGTAAQARNRIFETFERLGFSTTPDQKQRIVAMCGDLTKPKLGLERSLWSRLVSETSAIYHLAASMNVVMDYRSHRSVNVTPLTAIVEIALTGQLKPLFYTSPLTVCKRVIDGKLKVLNDERVAENPDGLLTGYSQSKWAAERVLMFAAEKGLPVKIYRSSHALPSSQSGKVKANDTYGLVLKVVCAVGVIPEWENSALHGVPVDKLAELIVKCSSIKDGYSGVVHLDNPNPMSMKAVIQSMLTRNTRRREPTCVSLDMWKEMCLQAAEQLQDDAFGLAKSLFSKTRTGTAVENMFAKCGFNVNYLSKFESSKSVLELTPESYWKKVSEFL